MDKIVRTPTWAEGGITAAEKEQMAKIVKEWTAIAYRTDPIDREKVTDAIERLYAAAGLKKPRVIVVPSPLVMACAYGASAWIWHTRKGGSTYDATDATRAATYAATYAATDDATDAATDANGAVRACRDLAGEGGIKCSQLWYRAYQGGNMWAGACRARIVDMSRLFWLCCQFPCQVTSPMKAASTDMVSPRTIQIAVLRFARFSTTYSARRFPISLCIISM